MSNFLDFYLNEKEKTIEKKEDIFSEKEVTSKELNGRQPNKTENIEKKDLSSIVETRVKKEEPKQKVVINIKEDNEDIKISKETIQTSNNVDVRIEQDNSIKIEKQQKNININKEIKKQPVNNQKPKIIPIYENEEEIKKIFIKTETDSLLYQQWKKIFRDSHLTKRKGYMIDKCKKGQFTINKDGGIEILPNFDTQGKNVNDLLKELTKPGRKNLNYMG